MNNEEGKEEPYKRGKKGMNNKEGKEEPWKRGKVKPEKKGGRDDHYIGHPFVLFSSLAFPLSHGSSFPSLVFMPFFPSLP